MCGGGLLVGRAPGAALGAKMALGTLSRRGPMRLGPETCNKCTPSPNHAHPPCAAATQMQLTKAVEDGAHRADQCLCFGPIANLGQPGGRGDACSTGGEAQCTPGEKEGVPRRRSGLTASHYINGFIKNSVHQGSRKMQYRTPKTHTTTPKKHIRTPSLLHLHRGWWESQGPARPRRQW